MQPTPCPDQHRALMSMITQSLDLADALGLELVGISLNGALEQLAGDSVPSMVTPH